VASSPLLNPGVVGRIATADTSERVVISLLIDLLKARVSLRSERRRLAAVPASLGTSACLQRPTQASPLVDYLLNQSGTSLCNLAPPDYVPGQVLQFEFHARTLRGANDTVLEELDSLIVGLLTARALILTNMAASGSDGPPTGAGNGRRSAPSGGNPVVAAWPARPDRLHA
jgi:hypothetical protein